MKNKIMFFVLVIITILVFLTVKFTGDAGTIEEAINASHPSKINIIHEEKHGKGSIVFCYTPDRNGLYTAVVRKGIMGYKTVYSGVQGDIKFVSEKFGISHNYFPSIEKVGLPIYFGFIGSPDISKVRIIEKKRGVERQAKIIESKGTRIWLVYMNGLEGSEFDILGYSKDGKKTVKIDGDISPLYVEQKPLKGYK
ncbi:hypothetical protein GOM49_15625 [Clostridium bovifaecis]|uniref:Uncharacterized protein n=1 Tax=Clostridium bovifaecis TaxID=2184719 RepID=A0A6I6EVE9_9CLOT|nr:hypothetical protein GOM49_15625 [Clostridium bovifaecis]